MNKHSPELQNWGLTTQCSLVSYRRLAFRSYPSAGAGPNLVKHNTNIYIYTYIYVCVCVRFVFIYTPLYIIYVFCWFYCVCVSFYLCMCVCVCIYIYIYIYIHTHTYKCVSILFRIEDFMLDKKIVEGKCVHKWRTCLIVRNGGGSGRSWILKLMEGIIVLTNS